MNINDLIISLIKLKNEGCKEATIDPRKSKVCDKYGNMWRSNMKGEDLEQATVIQWCNLQSCKYEELKWIYAVPNGGYRHPAEAKKLKATGTKRGVPDLFLPVARNGKHGLYIEMKYGKNKCTIEQVKWLDWLYKQGYMCKVCWSSEEAIAVIKEYLGIK